MQNNKKVQNTYSQKCAACGGDLVFNPKKQMLECVQCGNTVLVHRTVTTEKSFETLLKQAPQWQDETVVYHCQNCGAKAVVSKTDIAVKCDYCGATNIIQIEDLPGIKPDTVVLFKLTKEEAIARAKRWLSKRFFAPNWYKKTVRAKNVNGIYYPAFTFDAQTSSSYHGVEIVTHTQTTYVNGKPVVNTYTTEHPFAGNLSKVFDDVLIPAATTITPESFKQLQPFGTNDACVYQKEFLAGFTASHYTKDAMQCWREAKDVMDRAIRREITNRYAGLVEGLSVSTTTTNITYKYALLPLYVGHSEYDGKKYDLYVNGQTGKVHAKSPVSVWKVLFTTAAALAVVGGVIAVALFL